MQLLSQKMPANFDWYMVSDTHEGSSNQHTDGILAIIDQIAGNKNAYLSHGGDEIEAIMVDDKRYDRETCKNPVPLQQAEEVIKMFKPVRKKMLFMLTGNHPMKLHRFGNLTRDVICKGLDIPYGTYTTKFSVLDSRGKVAFKVFQTHGWGKVGSVADDPVRRSSNMKLQLKRKLAPLAGDALVMTMAHSHKLIVCPPDEELYLVDDGRCVKARYTGRNEGGSYIDPSHRWFVNTGSFLKTYGAMGTTGYAEMMMLPPTELGCAKMIVRDYQVVNIERIIL